MPEDVGKQEASEIKEKNTLTSSEEDGIMKRFSDLETKVNDFYLKPREPLKEDPVFEEFEKINKMRE